MRTTPHNECADPRNHTSTVSAAQDAHVAVRLGRSEVSGGPQMLLPRNTLVRCRCEKDDGDVLNDAIERAVSVRTCAVIAPNKRRSNHGKSARHIRHVCCPLRGASRKQVGAPWLWGIAARGRARPSRMFSSSVIAPEAQSGESDGVGAPAAGSCHVDHH